MSDGEEQAAISEGERRAGRFYGCDAERAGVNGSGPLCDQEHSVDAV